jgi:hypothetical protein
LSSTIEQIIPPPLNQRVRGSSPWRRTTHSIGAAQRTYEAPPRRGFVGSQGPPTVAGHDDSAFREPSVAAAWGHAPSPQRQLPPHPPRGGQERAHHQVLHRGRGAAHRLPRRAGSPANCERGQARRRPRFHRRPVGAVEAGDRPEPLPEPAGVLQVVPRRRRTRTQPDGGHEAAPAPRRAAAGADRRPAPPPAEVVRRSRLRRPARRRDHSPVHRHRGSPLRGGRHPAARRP